MEGSAGWVAWGGPLKAGGDHHGEFSGSFAFCSSTKISEPEEQGGGEGTGALETGVLPPAAQGLFLTPVLSPAHQGLRFIFIGKYLSAK